jgi:hypothetical protein
MEGGFKVGDLVSIVGQSKYKDEAIDGVITHEHIHASTGEIMLSVEYNENCAILCSLDGRAHTGWGGDWRIIPRVVAYQEVNSSLVLENLLPDLK